MNSLFHNIIKTLHLPEIYQLKESGGKLMGFYFKKSIKSGGVRFNFSKSGIGTSVGVKGFRVGTNSRGNYIHMGKSGLYYRAALGKKQSRHVTKVQSPISSRQLGQLSIRQEELKFHDIDSGDVAHIVDASSQDVVNEINANRKKVPLWPIAILLTLIPTGGILLALIGGLLLSFFVDKRRKTTVLIYDIDEDTEQEIEHFYNAFDELVSCNSAWHIASQASVKEKKYHAGANQVVKRTSIHVKYDTPKYLKTNVKVPSIPVGSQTIYFFPDRMLIYDKKAVGGLAYRSFSITQKNQRFIESETAPRDSIIVGHTWQYVNKSGDPDRRFANNKQLPILLYSDVSFTSDTGLNELVQFSKQAAGTDLIGKLEQYKRSTFLALTSETDVPASGTTTPQNVPPITPNTEFCSVDDIITDYVKNTPRENLFLMANIEFLVEVIKKAFPNETCTSANVTECVQHLVPVETNQQNEQFAPVQPRSQPADTGNYSSEKIPPNPNAKKTSLEPYATFKKMKQISGQYGGYEYSGDAEAFRNQALFMVNFADNYEENIPLDTYYTTYSSMNDAQLRTYFTWRAKVRQSIIEPTSLSYVFCYIYELINDIGVTAPADTIERLITLWSAYRKFDEKIDQYLRDWIRDYYVEHNASLPAPFVEYSARFPVPYHGDDLALLSKANVCSWDDLHVIEASSSFKITNGQFYKAGNQELIERCVCFVIRELAKTFKCGGVNMKNLFVEKRRDKIYSLYRGAVHVQTLNPQPIIIELDAFESMKYNARGWYKEYISITQYKPTVGYMMKLIEVKLREQFGYKKALKTPAISIVENCFLNSEPEKFNYPTSPTIDKLKVWKGKAFAVISSSEFEAAIDTAITAFLKANYIVVEGGKVRINKPVEIDMSKLKEIERAHIATAEKLITEEVATDVQNEPKPEPVVMPPVSMVESEGMNGLISMLSNEAKRLLTTLSHSGAAPANSELLIETINEQALESIGDNLIEYAEGTPYIYDDYVSELQQVLGGI